MRRHDQRRPAPPYRAPYLLTGALLLAVALAAAAALASGSADASAAAESPRNTSLPTIAGSAAVGKTLTATSGSWAGDAPITFTYQWRRCDTAGASCADIVGATGTTRVVVTADAGSTLRVRVKASNSVGSAEASSSPTATVTSTSAPVSKSDPAVSGSLVEGQTLSGTTGSWAGASPITYAYQWVRCGTDGGAPDGSNCVFIAGATGPSYRLQRDDVGHRMRLRVRATNASGAQTVASNATRTVAAAQTAAPKNTKEPSVRGTPRQGQTLAADVGGWSGTAPIAFAYEWLRCDGNGNNCLSLNGQTKSTFVPGASEVSTRVRVRITAKNSAGTAVATSNPTAAVQSGGSAPQALPAGAIKLPNGKYSIPASSVSLPARLIVDGISFTPNPVRSRGTSIELRVHVVDTRGFAVRDALVFARSTPIVTSSMSNQPTGQDGWVTLRLTPRASFPLARGHNVQFFVRARKAGENLLAGVSTRRLVQVRTAR
jgi:hypothetical protein